MVREDGGTEEALDDPEGTNAEPFAEHGEEAFKERHWPAELGEDEDDDLANDE